MELSIIPDENTMGDLQSFTVKSDMDLRVFVETAENPILFDDKQVFFIPQSSDTVTLILKHYDPLTHQLGVAGTQTFDKNSKISDLLPNIQSFLKTNSKILLFEEIKPGMIDLLDVNQTFHEAEIIDGDIICFQEQVPVETMDQMEDPSLATVPGYFDYIQNCVEVCFYPKEGPKEEVTPKEDHPIKHPINLKLSLKMTYDTVVQQLGKGLDFDPSKLRLYQSSYRNEPKSAIKPSSDLLLKDMLIGNGRQLFFETLDIPLSQLEGKRYVKVTYLTLESKEMGPFTILLEKTATVNDLLVELKSQVELPMQALRVFESLSHRKTRIFSADTPILAFNEYANLFVEVYFYIT
jgi:ubiquitin carboxyl-terminal hydrolase 7